MRKGSTTPAKAPRVASTPDKEPTPTPEQENALLRRLLAGVVHDLDALSLAVRRALG